MGQLIKNSDAHPETNTVDGELDHNDETATLTWHQIVTAAGNEADDDDTALTAVILWASLGVSNKWRRCGRVIMLFDTSALPDDCTIISATLQVYGNAKNDGNACTPDICVYSSNPASNNALIAADYATFGNTELSDKITYAGFTVDAWNTFTLNAAGRAAISKTGITKLGLRNASYDVADELDPNNHDPNWNSNYSTYLIIRGAEYANYEPILTVNYTTDLPAGTGQGIYQARRHIWSGGN